MQIIEGLEYTGAHLSFSCGSCWWTTYHFSVEGTKFEGSRHQVSDCYLNKIDSSVNILTGNVRNSSCRIHCTHAVGLSVGEVYSLSCQKTPCDEIILADFKVNGAASSVLGRCFIEVALYLAVNIEILDELRIIFVSLFTGRK